MTEAEIVAIVHRELTARGIVAHADETGWVPGVGVLRNALTELTVEQCVPANANASARSAVQSLRRLVGRFVPDALQPLLGPILDRLEAEAGDPVNGAEIAADVKGVVMPWWTPPE